MNYYDAQQIQRAAAQGLPVNYERLSEATAFLERAAQKQRTEQADARRQIAREARLYRVTPSQVQPAYAALCVCGSSYGAHRVNDYACPNKEWRPGNGLRQWVATQRFARAA